VERTTGERAGPRGGGEGRTRGFQFCAEEERVEPGACLQCREHFGAYYLLLQIVDILMQHCWRREVAAQPGAGRQARGSGALVGKSEQHSRMHGESMRNWKWHEGCLARPARFQIRLDDA